MSPDNQSISDVLDDMEAYLQDRCGYPAMIEIGGTIARDLLSIVRDYRTLLSAADKARKGA